METKETVIKQYLKKNKNTTEFDEKGRLVKIVDNFSVTTFKYDDKDRLVSESIISICDEEDEDDEQWVYERTITYDDINFVVRTEDTDDFWDVRKYYPNWVIMEGENSDGCWAKYDREGIQIDGSGDREDWNLNWDDEDYEYVEFDEEDLLYPIIWDDRILEKEDCNEMFRMYYHDRNSLVEDMGVYMTDKMWINPYGKIYHDD